MSIEIKKKILIAWINDLDEQAMDALIREYLELENDEH